MKRGLGSDQGHKNDENYQEQMAFKAKLVEQGVSKSFRIEGSAPPQKDQQKDSAQYAKKKKLEKTEQKNGITKAIAVAVAQSVPQPAHAPKEEVFPTPVVKEETPPAVEKKMPPAEQQISAKFHKPYPQLALFETEKPAETKVEAVETPAPVKAEPAPRTVQSLQMAYEINQMDIALDDARKALDEKAPSLVIADNLSEFYNKGVDAIEKYCEKTQQDVYDVLQEERALSRHSTDIISHKAVVQKFDLVKKAAEDKQDHEKIFGLIVEATVLCERDLMPHKENIVFAPRYLQKLEKK